MIVIGGQRVIVFHPSHYGRDPFEQLILQGCTRARICSTRPASRLMYKCAQPGGPLIEVAHVCSSA